MLNKMEKEDNIISKFYYPYCREQRCNGILNIKFDDNNFSVTYECDKNKNHKGKKIFFKTFERFYLKEKEIETCSSCLSILDYDIFYLCKKCYKIYCTLCFVKDEHIKKDFNNLEIKTKKCTLHKRELNQYCIECKKNYCIYCLKDSLNKESNDGHTINHNITSLIELMPTKEKINNLKNKIKEKNKFYEEIINSINQWEKELLSKTNRIKNNLKDEINLMEKIVYNFNQYFLNHTYYSIFYYFDNYLKNQRNEFLTKFKNSDNFENKTHILFEFFDSNKKNNDKNKNSKNELKKGIIEKYYSIDNGIIEKINNKYYFEYIKDENKIFLSKYSKKKDSINYYSDIAIENRIHSVSISKDDCQIYMCLSNKKIVNIIDYNLKTKVLLENKNAINDTKDTMSLNFNKCIKISNGYLATIDDSTIKIWFKSNNDEKKYNKLKEIYIYDITSDIILANNDYFITSQPFPKTLILIDIKSLTRQKYIPNIDCVDSSNCFLLYKDYIAINCKKGIALLLIKTKEICSYIENYNRFSENKEIFLDDKQNFCILNKIKEGNMLSMILFNNSRYYVNIIKFYLNDGALESFEAYDDIEVEEHDLKILCLNKGDIMLWGKNVYLLKNE